MLLLVFRVYADFRSSAMLFTDPYKLFFFFIAPNSSQLLRWPLTFIKRHFSVARSLLLFLSRFLPRFIKADGLFKLFLVNFKWIEKDWLLLIGYSPTIQKEQDKWRSRRCKLKEVNKKCFFTSTPRLGFL